MVLSGGVAQPRPMLDELRQFSVLRLHRAPDLTLSVSLTNQQICLLKGGFFMRQVNYRLGYGGPNEPGGVRLQLALRKEFVGARNLDFPER